MQVIHGQFNIIADRISELQTPSIIAERKCRNNIMEVIISK